MEIEHGVLVTTTITTLREEKRAVILDHVVTYYPSYGKVDQETTLSLLDGTKLLIQIAFEEFHALFLNYRRSKERRLAVVENASNATGSELNAHRPL